MQMSHTETDDILGAIGELLVGSWWRGVNAFRYGGDFTDS